MLIKSQAGEFDFSISKFDFDGVDLIVVGDMGVWEAKVHIDVADGISVLRKIVSSGAVWRFLIRLPFARVKEREQY